MEDMLRRGESSWSCMKFELVVFGGHDIFLIRIPLPSFLALPANELCPVFLPNGFATSCFVLQIFGMRFPNGIRILVLGWCDIFL
jgi:hypothetical protein